MIRVVGLLLVSTLAFGESRVREARRAIESAVSALEYKLIQPPRDQETCFSPEEKCDVKLVKFIQTAEKSIDVAARELTRRVFADALLARVAKGVRVRVIADREDSQGRTSLVSELADGGVKVRFGRQHGSMRNNFILVDGRMVETGSFVYTNRAVERDNENQVYLAGEEVVSRYKNRFDRMWKVGETVTTGVRIPAGR
jgi:phosphatidylserine/phosphatidylglycerophosphate/cardiolipin synthase-like enzyme